MKCKDCDAVGCGYRTSDAEKECQFQPSLICLPNEWQNVRIQAAIAALPCVMNSFGSIDYPQTIAGLAIRQADALIEELKKKRL